MSNTIQFKQFISPSEIKKSVNTDVENINKFIQRANMFLSRGKFSINTGLDNIPLLNDDEFLKAKDLAYVAGYDLIYSEDNYQTISYRFTIINQSDSTLLQLEEKK